MQKNSHKFTRLIPRNLCNNCKDEHSSCSTLTCYPLKAHRLDVKSALLHRDFKKEVFMGLSSSLVENFKRWKFCKSRNSP